MEDLITIIKRSPEIEIFKSIIDFEPYVSAQEKDVNNEIGENLDLKNRTEFITDESSYISELFKMKGFIGNEHWEKTININSRISCFNNDYVICECLIDKENKIFEQRSFPRYLFNHIDNIKTKPYVLLSIQSKTGSTRIDVIKGTNLVDKQAFEFKDEWDALDAKNFNQSLDKPIQL